MVQQAAADTPPTRAMTSICSSVKLEQFLIENIKCIHFFNLLLKLVPGKTVFTLKIVLTFQLPYSGANSGAI